jgi:Sec-independent protein translocase protein TatA
MLQRMLVDIKKSIGDFKSMIEEKTEKVEQMEKQQLNLEENIRAEKLQLEELTKKLQGCLELKQETDSYYTQIEHNIDTLMTILTTSRS